MKQVKLLMQCICAVALAAFLPACTTTPSSASASATPETLLKQAGFSTYVASTAEQKAHVQSMPAGKLTMVKRHGKNMWVYPDPANNRIYVGNNAQYQKFKVARAAQSGQPAQSADDDNLVATYSAGMAIPVQVYEGWVPLDQL